MKIKKQYELKDTVWVHIGSNKLTKGKIVDYFDLEHAGYSKDTEFYVVEIQTGIDPILEIRTWEQISQDANGPIGAYRELKELDFATKKFLGKVGIELPVVTEEEKNEFPPVMDLDKDPYDPTPEEINAAIERAERAKNDMYRGTGNIAEKPKKRNFPPRGRKPKSTRPA